MIEISKLFVLIVFIFSINSATKISSKIDLDDDEKCSIVDPVIIVIKHKLDVPNETSGFRPHGSKPISGGSFNFRNPGNSIRIPDNDDCSSTGSKVENIYIIVNGKNIVSSMPDKVNCKDNVCETTVTTNENDDDNERISSVMVKIFTKPNSLKIEDVPIVDGIRASGYDWNSPAFRPKNVPTLSYPHFIDNNVLQGQVPRRNPPRPQSASFYPQNSRPRGESTRWNPWIPGGSPIDDKIEQPLSKTDHVVH